MEKLIVVVFDEKSKARAGLQALRELDRDGEISLFEIQTVVREPNGRARVIENPEDLNFPVIGVSTLVGTFVGVLAGPVGLLGGAAAGALIGCIVTLTRADVTDEFVNDVKNALAPGKFAVVADIMEDWVTPLDRRMESLGGVVLRRTRGHVKTVHHDRDVAAHRVEMEHLKAERAQANADHLDRIDAALDRLGRKLERALLRERSQILRREEEREARIRALRAKADQSQEDLRRRLEARIAELQREYEHKDTLA